MWLVENVGDANLFMKHFKQRLIDCSIQDWSLAWHLGHVFRYLTLPDILLTERYITNEGLLP